MTELLIGWMTKPDYGWTLTDKIVILLEILQILNIMCIILIIKLIGRTNRK